MMDVRTSMASMRANENCIYSRFRGIWKLIGNADELNAAKMATAMGWRRRDGQ